MLQVQWTGQVLLNPPGSNQKIKVRSILVQLVYGVVPFGMDKRTDMDGRSNRLTHGQTDAWTDGPKQQVLESRVHA